MQDIDAPNTRQRLDMTHSAPYNSPCMKTAAGLLLFLAFALAAAVPAEAQRWLQTSQILTEITPDSAPRAFMDSLVSVAERNGHPLRRSESADPVPVSGLRDALINKQGIGLRSANYVFIDYRFTIKSQGQGFQETIETLAFVYRPPGGTGEDIQMAYVDASAPWVQHVLTQKGTPLLTNEWGKKLFNDQLSFARLQAESKIVEISGQTVREGFEQKKQALVRKIKRLTYESM